MIGVSLVLGWWVRLSSLGGIALMLAMTFSSWYEPGYGAAYWRYLGAHLDNIPLAMLFLLFLVFDAGKTWGADGGLKLPGK